MKILHIHPSLGSGGIEVFICNLSNEMVKRNDVTICSIFEISQNHFLFNKLNKLIHVFSLHKTKMGFQLSILWQIYRFIVKGNYDIVHVHGFFYYYFLAIFLLHKKIRFFYTVHNDAIQENTKWDKKLFFLKKYFFKKKWMIPVTISKASEKSFEELYGISGNLIYNGTVKAKVSSYDCRKYRISPKTKILFNPARISKQKNQIMLCENCTKLMKEGYDFVLLIAGSNQDNQIFQQLSPYFSDRIIYLGECSNVIDIMSSADAFCLSSSWEGMPISLLEALQVGCIPVCTPVGGIAEAVEDNISGFISNTPSSGDYYVTLKRYLDSDPDFLAKMKLNVINTFKRFDISKTALTYEKLYDDLKN